MSTIKVRCPECDTEQSLTPQAITLVEAETGNLAYRFNCRSCDHRVEQNCSPRIAGMLAGANVPIFWNLDDRTIEEHMNMWNRL